MGKEAEDTIRLSLDQNLISFPTFLVSTEFDGGFAIRVYIYSECPGVPEMRELSPCYLTAE